MMNVLIENAKRFAREVFASDSSGHDYAHTLRVYKLAGRIAQREGADVAIVELAALLHDVDDHKLSPDTAESKGRAVRFLRSQSVDTETIERIVHIIDQISFSRNTMPPDTLEGKCVQDADRLDAIGAIGIARAFAYGGNHNRLMYHPDIKPNLSMSKDEYIKSRSTTVNHFYEKLFLLTALMNTRTAMDIARERETYMREYIAEFMDEWEGKR